MIDVLWHVAWMNVKSEASREQLGVICPGANSAYSNEYTPFPYTKSEPAWPAVKVTEEQSILDFLSPSDLLSMLFH